MLTLWDLLKKNVRPKPSVSAGVVVVQPSRPKPSPHAPPATASPKAAPSMQERYDQVARDMLQAYGVRVRRWRTHMSGIAWEVRYRDGRVTKLIEAPRPKGPMSVAVFLHEIGHHAIGFNTYKPRCLEEYHAWAFAINEMHRVDLNVTEAVRRRMHNSLRYAIQKASRRGLKHVPPELTPFMVRWPGPPARRASRRPAGVRARS